MPTGAKNDAPYLINIFYCLDRKCGDRRPIRLHLLYSSFGLCYA